jgi:predicted phosphodiesterase
MGWAFRRALGLTVVIVGLCAAFAAPARAQSEPFKVFETRPVIMEGPYLVALSDTSVSIVWLTDTPSHSRVRYAKGTSLTDAAAMVEEPQIDGLIPIGTRHAITLGGLTAGTTYTYQVISTRVVKMKAYWPDKGLAVEGPRAQFTTFDAKKASASFSAITDTHEDVARINRLMKAIDWSTTDALVHLGDAFDWVDTLDQLFRRWLTPIIAGLGPSKPLLYARGNHELRGPFARELYNYVPTPEGRFYYARDIGPVHLLMVDTGEDKPDNTNVYAELNSTAAYRAQEFEWLRRAAPSAAPFRVIAMHQPQWGWLPAGNAEWISLANDAKIDLVIAGHNHRFSYEAPNDKHSYHLIVVGQDQVARVDATAAELKVTVTGTDGVVVKSVVIPRR